MELTPALIVTYATYNCYRFVAHNVKKAHTQGSSTSSVPEGHMPFFSHGDPYSGRAKTNQCQSQICVPETIFIHKLNVQPSRSTI